MREEQTISVSVEIEQMKAIPAPGVALSTVRKQIEDQGFQIVAVEPDGIVFKEKSDG